jgi:hypothetical protein
MSLPGWDTSGCQHGALSVCRYNINGHNLLASELKQANIKYTMIDNAFDSIGDADKAQELSDNISVEKPHRKLDGFAWQFCPVYKDFNIRYHWGIM